MTLFDRLGVRPIINAKGNYTHLGGSLMAADVVAAMTEGARAFVDINELEIAVGRYLAGLLGAEAALVTGGCAAAMVQTAAACMAGSDPAKIAQLPDSTGMRNEILIQPSHRNQYDQSFRTAGAKLIEVANRAELLAAIGPRTCAIAHTLRDDDKGDVKLDAALDIARGAGLPLLVDAAAELPPPENLTRIVRLGCDAVMFSGGKGLRGPQSSGLLIGKRDLIEAARLNGCPNHSVGRPMKAGKEEIAGLVRAVELYLARDHAAEWRRWEQQVAHVARAVADLPGVKSGPVPHEIVNHVPRVFIRWDEQARGLSVADAVDRLLAGEPRVAVLVTACGLTISPNTMEPGDELIVARRLRELLGVSERA